MKRDGFASGSYKKPPTLMVGGRAKISLANYYAHFANLSGVEPDLTCKILEHDKKTGNYVVYFKQIMSKAVFNRFDLEAI